MNIAQDNTLHYLSFTHKQCLHVVNDDYAKESLNHEYYFPLSTKHRYGLFLVSFSSDALGITQGTSCDDMFLVISLVTSR